MNAALMWKLRISRSKAAQKVWVPNRILLTPGVLAGSCLASGQGRLSQSKPVTLTNEGRDWAGRALKTLTLEESERRFELDGAIRDIPCRISRDGSEPYRVKGDL